MIDNESPSGNSNDVDNNIGDIEKELASVALDWKSVRSVQKCICNTPFDQSNQKVRYSLI